MPLSELPPTRNCHEKMEAIAERRTDIFSRLSPADAPSTHTSRQTCDRQGLLSISNGGSAIIARAGFVEIGGSPHWVVIQFSDNRGCLDEYTFKIIPANSPSPTGYVEFRMQKEAYRQGRYRDHGLSQVSHLEDTRSGKIFVVKSPGGNPDLVETAVEKAVRGMTEDPGSIAYPIDLKSEVENELFEGLPEDGEDGEWKYITLYNKAFNTRHAEELLRCFQRGELFLGVAANLADLHSTSSALFTPPVLYERRFSGTGTVISIPVEINNKLFELVVGSSKFYDKSNYFGGNPIVIELNLRNHPHGNNVVALKLQLVPSKGSVDMRLLSGNQEILTAETHGNDFTVSERNLSCHLFREDPRFQKYKGYHALTLKGRLREGARLLAQFDQIIQAISSQARLTSSGTIEHLERKTRAAAAAAIPL